MNWHSSMPFYQRFQKYHRRLHQFGIRAIIGTVIVGLMALPVRAAERVYFSYGALERSVAVSSLEAFAKDGTVNPDLAFFLRFFDADVRDQFRRLCRKNWWMVR